MDAAPPFVVVADVDQKLVQAWSVDVTVSPVEPPDPAQHLMAGLNPDATNSMDPPVLS